MGSEELGAASIGAGNFTQTNALVPVFLDDGKRVQQVASGVAVRLASEVFILCAAHVTDLIARGALCVPTTIGIQPVKGSYGSVPLFTGKVRSDDKDDVSYLQLAPSFAAVLDRSITPLNRDNVKLHETLAEGDTYTFGGYPVSKARSVRGRFESEVFLYSGAAAASSKYVHLGYDPATHILVNFNRKTSQSPTGQKLMPPHPKGISGGGVFAWRKDWAELGSLSGSGHLVAIGHTYLQQAQCLVGTRIQLHLALVAQACPHLAIELRPPENSVGLPVLMSMIWYRREEWSQLLLDFEDANKYPAQWNVWRHRAETGLETLGSAGRVLVPIELRRDEILGYCRERHLPNNSQTRLELANRKFMRKIRAGDL